MNEKEKKAVFEGRLFSLPNLAKGLLVGIYKTGKEKPKTEVYLDELKNLADTYGIETKIILPTPLKKFDPATFLGKGKVAEIKSLIEENNIEIVIFDDEILPQQQRNLEKELKVIVIDRTELILGVFYKHAKTNEAKMQVNLALLKYQLPRLKRMWTHLSRQRTGGSSGGYLKGEGERQIEIDKRILKTKIADLQNKIKVLKKQRDLLRIKRQKSNIPTFAIVGYTNAGKSTLLNALTDAKVLVEDKLFATLDTTTRKFTLPNNQAILLVDTVGFIRKIPHNLIAAFKSTLEEVSYCDILIHLIDASDPLAHEHVDACIEVLKELNAENKPMIVALNKIDKCEDKSQLLNFKTKMPKVVEISALNKSGFENLLELMIKEISLLRKALKLKIPQSMYHLVSLINKEGNVIEQTYEDNYVLIEAEIPNNIEYKVSPFIIN